MKEKPLKVQILEYLYNNGGIDDYIDLKPGFHTYFLNDQIKIRRIISGLREESLIKTSSSDYRLIIQKWANYDNLDIRAKLMANGEEYLRKMSTTSVINVKGSIYSNSGDVNAQSFRDVNNSVINIPSKNISNPITATKNRTSRFWKKFWSLVISVAAMIIYAIIDYYFLRILFK